MRYTNGGSLLMNGNVSNRRIAVVGLSCKFAGANNADEFWRLLESESCEFSPMNNRFKSYDFFYNSDKDTKGKAYNKKAAFFKRDIYSFDSDFFEISDKEAIKMDIQQRLLLETCYEAIEDAGIHITGSSAGVFIGGFMQDVLTSTMQKQNYYNLNGFDATGTSNGMLANKLSYFLDLHGPSISIDTACSSSLTAVYYACRSLIEGDCEIAICGGVNVLIELGNFIMLSSGGFLSAKSLCHAFGIDADGYARGEGVGILILKDLEKAISDRDKIYCEIVASNVNHDGRKSGITLPNPSAQAELLRSTIKKAGISVNDMSYFEAHGTGTQAGDKAELEALSKVFKDRAEKLIVGSVKTNIGHTEAAAGIAGLIKSIMILKNKQIPKTLHSEIKNPSIPFSSYQICLADRKMELPESKNGRHYIGINSFGFGGSNACAIISNVPVKSEKIACIDELKKNILFLSAKSKKSLLSLAFSYAAEIQAGALSANSIGEICASSAVRRQHHSHRLAIMCNEKEKLIHDLKDFANDISRENIFYKRCNPKRNKKCAFVFSGMGVQLAGMGSELYANFVEFKTTFDACSNVFLKISGINLKNIIMQKNKTQEHEADIYDHLEILQPFNLAYQIALFELAKRFGVEGNAFTGHSAGEMAAFYCGGLVSLEHIFEIAYHRSRLQQKLNTMGKMLVLNITREEAQVFCDKYSDKVSLAVVNGHSSVVLSGCEDCLLDIQKQMLEANIFVKFLDGGIAYHSFQMEMIKDEFMAAMKTVSNLSKKTKSNLYSTAFGREMNNEEYHPHYWWDNVRNTVEFYKTIETMTKDGYDTFIEIGPRASLGYYISEYFISAAKEYTYISAQSKGLGQTEGLYKSIAELYCSASIINLNTLYKNAEWLPLPKYIWDNKLLKPLIVDDQYIDSQRECLPVLGNKLNIPMQMWESKINLCLHKWIANHKVEKDIVFPAAGYIEMILETGAKHIRNIEITSPIIFNSDDMILNTVVDEEGHVKISSSNYLRKTWNKNCSARIVHKMQDKNETTQLDIAKLNEKNASRYEKETIYAILEEYSFFYKDGFKVLENVGIGENFALSEIYCVDPSHFLSNIYVIDGMLQTLALAHGGRIETIRNNYFFPSKVEEFIFYGQEQTEAKLFIYSEIVEKNQILL
ncbi:MAG: acyltransferase domain-containing protein [Fibromonadaceae bacterium]|jgi:acyl transferase domain-containing protein|nr:acyltransferase domain-containing protein [Fibromonadaceae bacterium]